MVNPTVILGGVTLSNGFLENPQQEEVPLTRVMALHALGYCERLFYLEEVEEIRVANADVYAGRRIHAQLPQIAPELTSFTIESERLGLKGKLDCVKRDGNRWVPFEVKKGRSAGRQGEGVWPSDELQLTAYAMLLEEHLGAPVLEGQIHYCADRRTITLPMVPARREKVLRAIARANELRRSPSRPPVTTDERLCAKCSLAPVCLPEEDRVASKGGHQQAVPRYFPEKDDGLTVHVLEPGARVGKAGERLIISSPGGESREIPVADIRAVVLHGPAQISTQAIHFCARREIPVHWLSGSGKYIGGISYGAGGIQRRIRQFSAMQDPNLKLYLSRKIAAAKISSQLSYLMRATRGQAEQRESITGLLNTIRQGVSSVQKANSVDEIRGYEGMAGKAYFSALPVLISQPAFVPNGRTRRPPRDPFNALLSFLYSLLYQDILQAIMVVGLDPCYGIIHTPRSAAYPLALDLQELFRVPLVDITAIGAVNRKAFSPETDFVRTGEQVWLSNEGKKKAIALYTNRKNDCWKHPVLKYSLSYERTLELEVRLLEKEWSGAPGLFAMSRLR